MRGDYMPLYHERNLCIKKILDDMNIGSVLDCGCGNGRLLFLLYQQKKYSKLTGIDISEKRIQQAKKKYSTTDIVFLNKSLFDLDKNFFWHEAIVASEIIEHFTVNELDAFCEIIFNICAPNLAIITTPNKSYNSNYETLCNGLRHSSHLFEFNEEELTTFLNTIIKKYPQYSAESTFCDSNHSSHLIILRKDNKNYEKQG